jgi:hypothetical protein
VKRQEGNEWACQSSEVWWGSIHQVCGSKERFIPIFEQHGGGGKEGKNYFNNVSMFALNNPILLMSMGTGE